ncbi:MAG: response regulator [Acetobacteraceae bacterium]
MAKSRAGLGPAGKAAPGDPALAAGRLVLLVDDDDGMREIVRAVLAEAGYGVLTAATGADGLRLLRERGAGIGLLIADYVMPGLNGLQLIRAARALRPRLPILLISGYARIEAVRELAGPPAAAFLRKPFRPAELLARIAALSQEDCGPS